MSQQNYLLNILKFLLYPPGNVNHFKMELMYSPFCDSTLIVSMVTTRMWYNSITLRMRLRFMKAEYHLELIINCICLCVGRGNDCSSSKMPKNIFSYLVTPPRLVAMVTRKMKYFEHFYFSRMAHCISGYS